MLRRPKPTICRSKPSANIEISACPMGQADFFLWGNLAPLSGEHSCKVCVCERYFGFFLWGFLRGRMAESVLDEVVPRGGFPKRVFRCVPVGFLRLKLLLWIIRGESFGKVSFRAILRGEIVSGCRSWVQLVRGLKVPEQG